jgi:hypothetical protein
MTVLAAPVQAARAPLLLEWPTSVEVAAGRRIRVLAHRFIDPYDVAVSAGGLLYVVETSQAGWLVRAAPSGRATPIPTG